MSIRSSLPLKNFFCLYVLSFAKKEVVKNLQVLLWTYLFFCLILWNMTSVLGSSFIGWIFICDHFVFLTNWPFYHYEIIPFLSLVMPFILKSILSDTNIHIPTFSCLLFVWFIFHYLLSISVSLYLKFYR